MTARVQHPHTMTDVMSRRRFVVVAASLVATGAARQPENNRGGKKRKPVAAQYADGRSILYADGTQLSYG